MVDLLNKVVLVTGAAGFIGSNLSAALLKRGDFVIGIDNFNDYYDVTQKRKNESFLNSFANFKMFEGDIVDSHFLTQLRGKKIDAIIHLAARAGVRPSVEDPALYSNVNSTGSINMLELAKENNIPQFIFGSSSSVYGNNDVPFKETMDISNPVSPYAATKRAGELYCKVYSNLFNLQVTVLRFFTVYGPRGRPDMTPFKFMDLIEKDKPINIYGDGNQLRDWTYVEDNVQGIIGALDNPFKFEIFNLGNDSPSSLNDMINIMAKVLNKTPNIKFQEKALGDAYKTWADISKAKEKIGYDPKTSLEEGMVKFAKWFKEER